MRVIPKKDLIYLSLVEEEQSKILISLNYRIFENETRDSVLKERAQDQSKPLTLILHTCVTLGKLMFLRYNFVVCYLRRLN